MLPPSSSTSVVRLLRSLPPSPPPRIKVLMASSSSSSSSTSASFNPGRSGRGRGRGGGGAVGSDRIDALGRLLTRVLRHMASELKLDMRSDGFVRVKDLLLLNLTTYAKVPLRSHTIEEIREAVRKDNKQRFSLLEENGELFIRANQGHSITIYNRFPP